jgi:hypothetical protein
MQSTRPSSKVPSKETVLNIFAAGGWRYIFSPLMGFVEEHSLTSPEGQMYVLPIVADTPPHVTAWEYYTTIVSFDKLK